MGTAAVQGELWGRHAQAWADGMEQRMKPLYTATLDELEPLGGLRVLDAGCGAGLALSMAAERGAEASGLDASAALLEVAARRTPAADLRIGDVDDLPWPDGSFDIVTAFNSIQYAADPASAVNELARVCRTGGRVAIGVWGDPTRCETEGLFDRLRALAPPPPGTPAPLGVSKPGVVEELMIKAGLRVVADDEVDCPFTFDSLDQAWHDNTAAGPLQKVIDAVGPQPVRAVVDEVLTADRKPDGSYRQDNVFRFVVAVR